MRSRRPLAALLVVVAATLGSVAASASPEGLVAEVVRLLDNGLESSVVEVWLDKQPDRPGTLSADDLIALERAGASPELIRKLVELSGDASPPPAIDPPAQARSTSTPVDSSSEVELALSIRYKPRSVDDAEIPDEPDLFVYLDGELVTSIASQTGRIRSEPVEAVVTVARGTHTVRVLRERHERRGRKADAPWRHEATVCPEAIELTIGDGDDWKLEIGWVEPRFTLRERGALSWELTAAGRRVDGASDIGTPKDDWPEVCEDVEASLDDGKAGKRTRRILERCLRWADLWKTAGTSRGQLLARLERDERR